MIPVHVVFSTTLAFYVGSEVVCCTDCITTIVHVNGAAVALSAAL